MRHRGVEVSVAGQVVEGLTIVAGTRLLQPRVAATVTGVGTVPLGPFPRVACFDVVYGPEAWHGSSLDGRIDNHSARTANSTNSFKVAGRTTANLGARYNFRLGNSPATLRAQVINLTNDYSWDVSSAGTFAPNDKRRYLANITVDF